MTDYIISCCSTADLSQEHFEKRNIFFICFHYKLDGKDYPDDLGKSMPFKEFYNKMANGSLTKTSQVNIEEYEEYFENFLKQGKDILHVSLSSGLSGTVNSAKIAKINVLKKYPDRKIYIVDSLGASSGYGLLMDKLADLRDSGMSIDEVFKFAENNKLNLHHWFFSTDLSFFIRGGRISKTSGFFGKILGICPLLNMNVQGKLIPREKVKGKQKVCNRIVEMMAAHAQQKTEYNQKCYISHSNCVEDANYVANLVEQKFKNLNGKIEIYNIGTTIGSHTGPGTVALFFWGDNRTF